MKRILFFILLLFFFFALLFHPDISLKGATNGLLLWYRSIIPTLFPFVVLTNLLIGTNVAAVLSRILSPLISRLFCVSKNACFAILVGFLCGYPMGAKVTSDLVERREITKKEGQYLLSFCNNTSPMFIISYIVLQTFADKRVLLPSLCILLTSPVVCSFLFRFYHKPSRSFLGRKDASPITFQFSFLDNAIMNGFETITKVGGYMILFSIVLEFFAIPSLEITGGIAHIAKNHPVLHSSYVPIMALTSFGGWCSVAQTKSMIQSANLSILPYIIEKLITAMVTSLLSYCYLHFFILP